MKKVAIILLCMVFLSVFLVSCAGSANQESGSASTPDPSTEVSASGEPSSETSADGADALQKIKDAGKLVMLTNATFPPYEYRTTGSAVAGADVEIVQLIADEIGVELEVVDMDFDAVITALQSGKGDIVAAGMTITPERQEAVDFSVPYTDATQLIIIREDDPKVSSSDDFEGKTIGVQLGTTGDTLIQFEIEDGANIELVQYKSNMEAAMDLQNGRLDAIVLDEMPAKSIAEANDGLITIDEPFTEEQYAMAVKKGNSALLEVVDKVLSGLVAEGKVAEIIEKHAEEYAALNQ